MSRNTGGPRASSVSLRLTDGSSSLPSISGRAIYQYWALLVPHFRGIFLPPQWRADGTGVTWSWRGAATPTGLGTSDLATIRRRLNNAQRSLADAAEDAPAADPRRTVVSLQQISACTGEFVAALVTLPDPALAAYVIRGEQGLMLHSWGLPTALDPHAPKTDDDDPETADPSPPGDSPSTPASRRRWLIPALVAVVLLGGGLVWWLQSPATSTRRSGAETEPGPIAVPFVQTSTGALRASPAPTPSEIPTAATPRRALGTLPPPPAVHPTLAPRKPASRPATPPPAPAGSDSLSGSANQSSTASAAAPAPLSSSQNPAPATSVANPTAAAPSSSQPPPTTASAPIPNPAPPINPTTPPPADTSPSTPPIPPPPPPEQPHPNLANTAKSPPPLPPPQPTRPKTSLAARDEESDSPEPKPNTNPLSPPHPTARELLPPPSTNKEFLPTSVAPRPETTLPAAAAASREQPGSPELVTIAAAAIPAPRLHRTRSTFSPWQVRLHRDAILPTRPTARATAPDVAALRRQVFAERQTEIPAWLSPVHLHTGYALTLPAHTLPAQWENLPAPLAPHATINGPRAEISWDSKTELPSSPLRLRAADGQLLATLTIAAHGDVTLTTSPEVLGWPWLALSAPRSPVWEILHGPAAPPTWQRDATANRLDLIPGPADRGLHQRTLALIDPVTGWSLVSELALTVDSSGPLETTPAIHP